MTKRLLAILILLGIATSISVYAKPKKLSKKERLRQEQLAIQRKKEQAKVLQNFRPVGRYTKEVQETNGVRMYDITFNPDKATMKLTVMGLSDYASTIKLNGAYKIDEATKTITIREFKFLYDTKNVYLLQQGKKLIMNKKV